MKSLTAITGNMDDMDQTVLSIEEYARLMSNLGDLRLENIRLKQQLQALAEAGAASEDMQLMRLGYAAATVENEDLRARVQELGELARNNNSRRVVELEAQLEAIGAGGVEPLRKRQGHVEDDLDMVAADAARYRWLRDPSREDSMDEKGNFIPGVISGLFVGVDESRAEGINGAELDAAIDAAMRAKQGAAVQYEVQGGIAQ